MLPDPTVHAGHSPAFQSSTYTARGGLFLSAKTSPERAFFSTTPCSWSSRAERSQTTGRTSSILIPGGNSVPFLGWGGSSFLLVLLFKGPQLNFNIIKFTWFFPRKQPPSTNYCHNHNTV